MTSRIKVYHPARACLLLVYASDYNSGGFISEITA